MQIAFVLYPQFTALDIIGPFQVLADLPGHDVVFVAAEAGPVMDHTGRCELVATATFDQVTAPDIVVVPGTIVDADPDEQVVQWLRQVHPTTIWTTSVCTGSIYLAAADILDGVDATCHWVRAEHLERLGARYTEQRVVERGKVITGAGVSASIDMGLVLLDRMYGPETAQIVQLGIEYDPQPPFDAGSPSKAPAHIVEAVSALLAAKATSRTGSDMNGHEQQKTQGVHADRVSPDAPLPGSKPRRSRPRRVIAGPMRRMAGLLLLAVVAVLLGSTPASAQGVDDVDALVVITGRAHVEANEELETVVIVDGPATIDGTVRDHVIALNGDVHVNGTVRADVVAFTGRVTVADGGQVNGDVVSAQSAVVDPGATVSGQIRRFDPDVLDAWFGVVTRLAWWLAVSVSVLVLGLLAVWTAPRVVDATAGVARTATGPAIGGGLAALIGVPVAAVISMLTVIGLPLGLYLLGFVGVVSVLGYTAAASILGRRMVREPRSRALAFLAGLAVLRVVALVPFLGGLVWFGAAVFGTGALVVAAWRARVASTPAAVTSMTQV